MNVLKKRGIYLSVSAVLFVSSILLIFIPKLNLGIDMTGGTQTEYQYANSINIDEVRNSLEEASKSITFEEKEVINSVSVYKISGVQELTVVSGFDDSIDEKNLNTLKNTFREKVKEILLSKDETIVETSYTNIGKSFGDYIKNTAVLTLIIAILAITIYITYSFSGVVGGISVFSFSFITLITLFHDVILSSGAYIFVSLYFPEFKIDTFFVTALLTILGYSINDTIVIFDRIRANLRQFGGKTGKDGKTLEEIIHLSVNESMKRSIYTSLTLLFVLLTVFFFGPDSISGFILVMIFGTIIGTYSSVFVASPVLYIVNKNKKITVYKKKVISPEDKIVV